MASGLGEYRKLPVKRYAVKATRETAEGRYWREYRSTTLAEQVNGVTSVSYGGAGRRGRARDAGGDERGEGDAVCAEWGEEIANVREV